MSGKESSADAVVASAHADPRAHRMPDFFLVGQPKSGTTALYEMLRRHPRIFMPENKEPWFLAQELLDRAPPRPQGTPRTLTEYQALFSGADPEQLVGEATAMYLWSPTAAERIAQARPDARIIVILREPTSLLRSLHLQWVKSYVETETDLRRALELEPARRQGREIPRYTYWPQGLLYSDHVRYVEQLRRYHRVFPPEQVLTLIYDDFRRDNASVVRRVLSFLGVDENVQIEPREANPTVAVRSGRLHGLVHAVSVGRGPVSRAVKETIKAVTPRALRRDALHAVNRSVLYSGKPPDDDELMLELRRRYRGEVAALSEYIDRDLLALWGYDELA